MLLIITHKTDYTADYVINLLNQTNTPYLRLNCEDLLNSPQYSVNSDNNFAVLFTDNPEITSVWFRRTLSPDFAELSIQERFYFKREFDALLDNLSCALIDKRWLGEPFAVRRAENKILQLKVAVEVGFQVPRTLITNEKNTLRAFFSSNLQTVLKPLYSGQIPDGVENRILFTSTINQSAIDQLNEYDLTPCIYQEYIEKEYEIRVTIINDAIFAAKVDSQANSDTKTDWRRGQAIFTKYELPIHICEQCVMLCEKLKLKFGCIDLIKTKQGKYVFLEINPNGQWAWIEIATGMEISKAIIKYLST